MANERVILSNGGVCNVDTSDHYPGALHVTINGGATLTPPECDALIAAIGRALGRPAPTSPRYTPSDELRFIEPICAALALQCATQEEALDAITKAMQDYRAKAVKLALEQTRPMVVVLDGGRPTPTSTPLEERLLRAWDKAKNESETHPNRERAVYCDGTAQGLRAALAMVREQGATVPRAGVLPILDDLRSIATALDFENTPGACSAWRRLEEAIGTLAKLTAAPTTQTEKG